MLRSVLTSAIVSVGGGLLLVPWTGIMGAAVVIAGIDLAGWLASLPSYRRVIGSLQFRAWIRPALGGACIIVSSYFLRALGVPVWGRVPLSASTYIPFAIGEVREALR